jgi:hypothetical protein
MYLKLDKYNECENIFRLNSYERYEYKSWDIE